MGLGRPVSHLNAAITSWQHPPLRISLLWLLWIHFDPFSGRREVFIHLFANSEACVPVYFLLCFCCDQKFFTIFILFTTNSQYSLFYLSIIIFILTQILHSSIQNELMYDFGVIFFQSNRNDLSYIFIYILYYIYEIYITLYIFHTYSLVVS